ncbi:winged helix-turn-helix domain-containing protein [Demequina sp. TTPB684]|uniref:ArsR/SmtB family transcription factor n=1 Tax=unclassified Demequina TaxID=2620311 RepID=UPI001CF5C0AA|nr:MULTISPECIES: winged helix-turn-helix domain-containing protein [unclassified Demequina]MCB2414066.1 winged helix-turn-helix domain-containing protein [Demequina sp. TTPB684]UPU89223.1 winged helix-turn-helix domain-containing protein [Demequina sp. TMPB413]
MTDDSAPPENASPHPPWPVRRIDDPKELRALAHPVRFALLDLLAEGPLTASQCAERLGESPANCSYHLRQLAKFAHVRPVEGGRGRERYWASREEGISIADDGPGGEAAARAVGEAVDNYRMTAWRSFVERRRQEPETWRAASLSTDLVSWLTPEELERVTQGVYDLFAPFEERDSTPETRPKGARAVRFFAYAFPGAAAASSETGS